MPKLDYSTPPPSLLRELREVASDAGSLAAELGKANRLPSDLPIVQLRELLVGLQALPSGTGEGSRSPLETALSRLAALRKRYFQTEEQSRQLSNDDEPPPLTRGMVIDQRLGALVSSIMTALDEYRVLASDERHKDGDVSPSISIDASSNEIVSALEAAKSAEQNLLSGVTEIEIIADPSSATADSLKRQMRDARGLLQLARIELRMPEFVPQWYRRIIDALLDYPGLLLRTSKAIQIGVDVARPIADAWSHFEHGFFHLVIDSFERASHGLGAVARMWDTDQPKPDEMDFIPFAVIRDTLANGQLGPRMVVVPAGEYLMGSKEEETRLPEDDQAFENEVSSSGKKHPMRIAKPFAMGRYLVTYGEYSSYCRAMSLTAPDNSGLEDEKCPVVNVSWNDAQKYIQWLNQQTGKIYRLPSEAEWEYCCRGDTDTRRWWGDTWSKNKANGAQTEGHVSPVDRYPPNPWGFHDMIGNVWEWCADIYVKELEKLPEGGASHSVPSDGGLNRRSISRVLRGGSLSSAARLLRAANRSWDIPNARDHNVGFRVVRALDQ